MGAEQVKTSEVWEMFEQTDGTDPEIEGQRS